MTQQLANNICNQLQEKNGSSKHSPFLIALAFAQPIICNDPMAPLVVTNDVEPKLLSCIDVTP